MLRNEAEVLRSLEEGTYTLDELYNLAEQRSDTSRDNGDDLIHGNADLRWRRRVRGACQAMKAAGRAERVDRGVWAIKGTPRRPERLLLIVAGATVRDFELRLQAAVELLQTIDAPVDLVLADPPYGLDRGSGRSPDARIYRRDPARVLPGYVDVPSGSYREFCAEWIAAAGEALRDAGTLAVITGPQAAAACQVAAEDAGLTWVASIAAFREFALRSTRRPAASRWTVTVMTRGRLDDRRRVFNPPTDEPRARSGIEYPLDWWPANGNSQRPGQIRNDNELPLRLVKRIVDAFSNPEDLVVDPFLGAGTSARAAYQLNRRFIGGDLNPHAVSLAAARLLDDDIRPAERAPLLFDLAAA